MSEKKLYSDDRDIPYKTSTIPPLKTRSDIDGILAKWGITQTAWDFDIKHNRVFLQFVLPYEKFGKTELSPVIRLEPPRIWKKKSKRNPIEEIDWKVSMRVFFWFIKTMLEMAYAMSSQKAIAFLPYIQVNKEQTLKDILIPKMSFLKQIPEKASSVDLGGRIEIPEELVESEIVKPEDLPEDIRNLREKKNEM